MIESMRSPAAVVTKPGLIATLVLGRNGNPDVSPLKGPGCSLFDLHAGTRAAFTGPAFFINLAPADLNVGDHSNPSRRRSKNPGTAPGAEYASSMVLRKLAEA